MDTLSFAVAKLSEECSRFRVLAVRDDDSVDVDLASQHSSHGGDSDQFVFGLRVKNHENRRHSRVDLSVVEEAVGDIGDGEALAVKIGKLLHLEATFLGDGFGDALAKEHDTFGKLELFRVSLREFDASLEGRRHVRGEVAEFVDEAGSDALGLVVALHLGEPESD